MADKPAIGDKRPVTPSRPSGAAAVQSRHATHRTPGHRRAVIIGCGILLTAAGTAAALVAAGTSISVSGHSSNSPRGIVAAPDSDLRTAKITRDSGGKECWQETLDNQTWHITGSPRPCETTTYDGNGDPVPVGTIHRLDAISKSFPGH